MALIGAGLALGGIAQGVGSFLGSRAQVAAAERAAAESRALGQEQAALIRQTTPQARRELTQGFSGAQQALADVDALLAGGQQDLAAQFAQERAVGQQALGRLNEVILGGDFSQLQIDPGFAFRQQQGEQAIQRQAAAAGSFGGGGNLRDFARFNQDLASQEFQNAIGRLAGLQQVGSAANVNLANLNQQLLGLRAGVGQNQANVAQNRGSALAQLTQSAAANQANVLANQQANVNAFNLQAANAQAAGIQGLGGAVGNAATLFALSQLAQNQPNNQGVGSETSFFTDPFGFSVGAR